MNWQISSKVTISGVVALVTLFISLTAAAAVLYSRLTVIETRQNAIERSIETDIKDIKEDVWYIRDRLDGIK